MKFPHVRLILARLALSLVAIVLSLLAVEILIRLFFPHRVPSAGVERDFFCQFDPQLGWAPLPNKTAEHERDGFSVLVHQNSLGLRAPDSLQAARHSQQRRILVLGDSYVWGYGVEQSQMMTAPEVTHTSAELINFGVSGYGTDQEYLFYSRLGTKFDVDEVILVFTPYNDVEENISQEAYDHYKPFFVVENEKLVLHTEHIHHSRMHEFINRLGSSSSVINLFEGAVRELGNRIKVRRLEGSARPLDRQLSATDITQRDRDGVNLTLRIISALRDEVVLKGAKFSVVFVPYKPNVLRKSPNNHPLVPLLARGLATTGITYYEPYDLFLKASQEGISLFHAGDNHFSPAGNELFARALVGDEERRSYTN